MQDIFDLLKAHADSETAVGMSAYQRNQFPFLGIKTPVRRELTKPFIKAAKQSGVIDWDLERLLGNKMPVNTNMWPWIC